MVKSIVGIGSMNSFGQQVLALDPSCRNPWCQTRQYPIHPHHIIYKSQGGKDEPENGIGLCLKCHTDVHLGITWVDRGVHVGARRLSGRSFMLQILKELESEPFFRWHDAMEELKRSPEIVRQDASS
jgi:hypothetical protein